MSAKPDLIIAAVSGLQWGHIGLFANSIIKSGFSGETVVLAANMDGFAMDCLRNRGFSVVPFSNPPNSPTFVTKDRFVALQKFLRKYGSEYRYVIWVDATDQIFQSDPTVWLDRLPDGQSFIAARECWKIEQEQQFNLPWMKNTISPDDWEWLVRQEIVCGGTIAGDVQTVLQTIDFILKTANENPRANDQSSLAYVVHKPFFFPVPTRVYIPSMRSGWTATCSAFATKNFQSPIGIPDEQLTDQPPVFDLENELVLTPDGKKPFVLVHQYNRDERWIRAMYHKYYHL